ncbi:MAG: transposase DNA-binding-containing protein, partial [Bacteroidia bacterium]|nr:transposase DNA-binding-containing protein [Bacteroidia bacterium]
MLGTRIFSAESSSDFAPGLASGQRYRHSFGDKRLAIRHQELLTRMCRQQSAVVNQLSKAKKEQSSYYRFLSNPKVTPPELIYTNLRRDRAEVQGKDLLVIQDTSIGFRTKRKRKAYGQAELGVIEDNDTPGFSAHCSLLIDRDTCALLGLGDIVLSHRPLNTYPKEVNQQARTARRKLPLEAQESFVWALGASNCQAQLQGSRRLTFVRDQGSDKYEILTRILGEGTSEALWRSRENRQVMEGGKPSDKRLTDVLAALPWSPRRPTPIRALNHYSKTHGKSVQRQERTAAIGVRYAKVSLAL